MTEEKKELEKKEDKFEVLSKETKIPSEQLKRWKETYGKLYKISLGADIYLIRALTRLEFKTLQGEMMLSQNATQIEAEAAMEEALVKRCLLAPQPTGIDFFNATKAGTLTSLAKAIQWNSDFLPPEIIISSTEEI